MATLPTNENAFLEEALPNTICGAFGTDKWEPCTKFEKETVFLGKRAGKVKNDSPNREKRCNDFIDKYEQMKSEAKLIIDKIKAAK